MKLRYYFVLLVLFSVLGLLFYELHKHPDDSIQNQDHAIFQNDPIISRWLPDPAKTPGDALSDITAEMVAKPGYAEASATFQNQRRKRSMLNMV